MVRRQRQHDPARAGASTYNLGYDAENRLTSVSGAATATFVYDGDGNRVKATVGGVTTTYIGSYAEWSRHDADEVLLCGRAAGGDARREHALLHVRRSPGQHQPGGHLDRQRGSELRYRAGVSCATAAARRRPGILIQGSLVMWRDFGLTFYNARWLDPGARPFRGG